MKSSRQNMSDVGKREFIYLGRKFLRNDMKKIIFFIIYNKIWLVEEKVFKLYFEFFQNLWSVKIGME